MLVAEFVWPAQTKLVNCPSLKPIHKNQQEDLKFTFDVSKCDRIFHELLKFGYIKISHALPSLDELKRRAYCKYHNSFSHATSNCNVFCRQIQSALNEGRLSPTDMQVDKVSFPDNVLEKGGACCFDSSGASRQAIGKNVIIGEPQEAPKVEKISGRKVVLEKDEDGKNKLKITAGLAMQLNKQRQDESVVAP